MSSVPIDKEMNPIAKSSQKPLNHENEVKVRQHIKVMNTM